MTETRYTFEARRTADSPWGGVPATDPHLYRLTEDGAVKVARSILREQSDLHAVRILADGVEHSVVTRKPGRRR